jgi:hypothetical protein
VNGGFIALATAANRRPWRVDATARFNKLPELSKDA